MSTVYTQAYEILNELSNASIFDDNFTSKKAEVKEFDKADHCLQKLCDYLGSTKNPKEKTLEKYFSNLYKCFDLTRKYEQVLLVLDCVFFVQTCINTNNKEDLFGMTLSEIDFIADSSSSEEMSTDDSTDDSSDDDSDDDSDSEDDSEDDSEEGDSEDEEIIDDTYLAQINRFLNKISKAKIFDKEIDDNICDELTVSECLVEVHEEIGNALSVLSTYLNGRTSNYRSAKVALTRALENLDVAYDVIGDKNEEQLYILKDRVHWLTLIFDMDNKRVEKEMRVFNLDGLKLSR